MKIKIKYVTNITSVKAFNLMKKFNFSNNFITV